ncbi:MAG: c-type cytochrome [Dehalococcoidia bacterium]
MKRMRGARLLLGAALAGLFVAGAAACTPPSGEQGEDGPIGPPGQRGKPGADGVVGDTGVMGPVGQAGPEGPLGSRGGAGERGPAGQPVSEATVQALVETVVAKVAPSDDVIRAIVEEMIAAAGPITAPGGGAAALAGDPIIGGLLFDNWPKVTGTVPEGEHGLWERQDTNTRTGVATWRCKECHGWDYKGEGGAYGDPESSHYTGFLGLVQAGRLLNQDQIVEVLHGGLDTRHDFTDYLLAEEMAALAAFIKTEIINEALYINYETKQPRIEWDADTGLRLYGRTCAPCHGDDGAQINFGSADSPVFIGTLAADNPWEFVHKTRFGQPGTPGMPASEARGWNIEDVIAVLGHAQSLRTE